MLKVKRIYESPDKADGFRVLVDRLWPRGVSKERAHLDLWLKSRGVIGLSGIDTRALTSRIRENGMPNAVIAHEPSGRFDLDVLKREAREWPGIIGMDLVPMVTTAQRFKFTPRIRR